MSKANAPIRTTEDEIDAAIERGRENEPYRPKAIRAAYHVKDDTFHLAFESGAQLILPRHLLQGLENATSEQLAEVEIVDLNSGLRWESLDVDHYIPSLLEGVFGNRRWMVEIGQKGGAKRSPAKTAAARRNGRKGGRPKRAPLPQ